jgi:hypothetical protein
MVKPNRNMTVTVWFDDGKIKTFNAEPLAQRGGVYAKLYDEEFFVNRCVILNKTLAWDLSGSFDPDNCIDVCSDLIYNDLKLA